MGRRFRAGSSFTGRLGVKHHLAYDANMGISVGYIEKQTAFAQRHGAFFERRANLMRAINMAFDRTLEAVGNLDPLIFYLGMRAVDDFEPSRFLLRTISHCQRRPRSAECTNVL